MKFCPHCASPLVQRIPSGDDKLRYCCDACNNIHYQNPKNVVGTLPVQGDRVLLCKRAIEPRLGKWTLPAGFLENGETSLEGAIRETHEEAGATIKVDDSSLYTLFNLPAINQMYLFFRAEVIALESEPGFETETIAWFTEGEIPWKEIAFAVVRCTLEQYFKDVNTGHFPVRMFDVLHSDDRSVTTHLISRSQLAGD